MSTAKCWVVTWTYNGRRCLIDTTSKVDAESLAIQLAESGRQGVMVVQEEVEIDDTVRERIWERVKARLEREIPDSLLQASRK